jgi:hypothetical protein
MKSFVKEINGETISKLEELYKSSIEDGNDFDVDAALNESKYLENIDRGKKFSKRLSEGLISEISRSQISKTANSIGVIAPINQSDKSKLLLEEAKAVLAAELFIIFTRYFKRIKKKAYTFSEKKVSITEFRKGIKDPFRMAVRAFNNEILSSARYIGSELTHRLWEEAGIKEALWVYTFRSKTPRPNHLHAGLEGKKYDVSKGAYIGGEYIYPGQLKNCKCIGKAIYPTRSRI